MREGDENRKMQSASSMWAEQQRVIVRVATVKLIGVDVRGNVTTIPDDAESTTAVIKTCDNR